MFTLTHEGDNVGATKLESGDPSILAVSGAFVNMGGAKALAGFIKSIGGSEDDGVVFVSLNDDFALKDEDGNQVSFAEASLIAIPADEEAYLDITGLTEEDYKTYFAEHLSALDNQS
ncbi:MAG: hypothetical protein MI976_01750 [Pseudomonadales bacterium]|nr:hypothetical protein [Pseudomonadales bacterium]